MDKQKIIKIVAAVIVGISAIVYYFINTKDKTGYEEILVSNMVVNNSVEESVEEKNIIKVYVTGEVNTPGVIELEEGARIQDAIEGAGGIKPEANLNDMNLAYEVSDGEKIYIPNLADAIGNEELETDIISSTNSKVNINKATISELTEVSGIGASTAQKIITYREKNGKFKAIEDIKNVPGIGDSKYENIKDFICVK